MCSDSGANLTDVVLTDLNTPLAVAIGYPSDWSALCLEINLTEK